jgi:hypothetical protein
VLLKAKVKANALNSGLFADMKKAPHRGLLQDQVAGWVRQPEWLVWS